MRDRRPTARANSFDPARALFLMDADRLEEAQQNLRQALLAQDCRRGRWYLLPACHFLSALGRFWSGEWNEACTEFNSGMIL
jgi:hypothetical protein